MIVTEDVADRWRTLRELVAELLAERPAWDPREVSAEAHESKRVEE